MRDEDWADRTQRVVGMLIDGEATDEVDERGRPVSGQTVLLLFNGGDTSRRFVIPQPDLPGMWEELVNTARPGRRIVRGQAVNLVGRSFILARLVPERRAADRA
jgi:glycogen operon protein